MKNARRTLLGLSAVTALVGFVILLGWVDQPFVQVISALYHKMAAERWTTNLHIVGRVLLVAGAILALFFWGVFPRLPAFARALQAGDARLDAFLHRKFQGVFTFPEPGSPSSTPVPRPSRRINRVDLLIAVLFFLFSLFYLLAKLQNNYPIVLLGGDAGNIASFAAAYDHPDIFQKDMLLGNLDNIRVYNTLHIPLIRALNRLTGDYGMAFSLLLPPVALLQLLGYYILGRMLFKNRWWAFLFSVLVAVPFDINLQEGWGFFQEPIPRFTYQALLPFLLALTLAWKNRPARWPWLMAAAGLLFYAHPVSAPTGGLVIWLGLWFFLPPGWSRWKRLAYMFGLGLVFLAAASPFILNYFTHHVQGQTPDAGLILTVINTYFPANLLNVPAALADFARIIWQAGLLPLAIIGLALTWVLRRSERQQTKIILIWVAGFMITSAGVPYLLRIVERYALMAPIESELIRGIRYSIPFMLLFCLWPLSEISQRLKLRPGRLGAAAAGLALVAAWALLHPVDFPMLGRGISCLSQGKLICVQEDDTTAAVRAIREKGAACDAFMSYYWKGPAMNNALTIRYGALKPLLYAYKDRGLLGYSNPQTLRVWYDTTFQFLQIKESTASHDVWMKELVGMARARAANCLLIDLQVKEETFNQLQVKVLYRNPTYTLVWLPELSPAR